MGTSKVLPILRGLLPVTAACALGFTWPQDPGGSPADEAREPTETKAVQVQFLEIVTPEVEGMCETLAELHGVEFSDPVLEFGLARTAPLASGGLLSVRAPMREDEAPVVRPYILVDDIGAAVTAAREAGAEIAIPLMEIPGRGKIAIYIQGGIQHGLWQR